jgi:receptor protein-tyrosine kinase
MTEVLGFAPRAGRRFVPFIDAEAETRRESADETPRLSPLLSLVHAPTGAAAESIRAIRTALMAASFARGGGFALVAARAGQGASVLAANLALAFAQVEIRTLLVDANLRRPGLSALFGLSARREGLAECLARREEDAALAREVAPNLAVVPAGAPPPNPVDLIASKFFEGLAARWAREFDLVIYDAPAALACAETALIAARAGAAVIAARLHAARFDDVRRVSADLRAHGCAITGVVGAGCG